MAEDLSYKTWQSLVKLTGENVTDAGLAELLKRLAGTDQLSGLSQAEAEKLLAAISPLPGLRAMLWEGAAMAIETMNANLPKGVSRFDAQAAAEAIVPYQLDKLAALLATQHQVVMPLHNEIPKAG